MRCHSGQDDLVYARAVLGRLRRRQIQGFFHPSAFSPGKDRCHRLLKRGARKMRLRTTADLDKRTAAACETRELALAIEKNLGGDLTSAQATLLDRFVSRVIPLCFG
jgi:hypothetical protein